MQISSVSFIFWQHPELGCNILLPKLHFRDDFLLDSGGKKSSLITFSDFWLSCKRLICSAYMVPCPWQGGWNRWSLRSLPSQSILLFYDFIQQLHELKNSMFIMWHLFTLHEQTALLHQNINLVILMFSLQQIPDSRITKILTTASSVTQK